MLNEFITTKYENLDDYFFKNTKLILPQLRHVMIDIIIKYNLFILY